jgi:polyhydroxyalkanoate synthesis regulator phasin
MENETYFDKLFEAQRNLVDSVKGASKELVKTAFGEESLPSKSIEMVNDLIDRQRGLVKELTNDKDMRQVLKQSPELLQKWLELQKEFGQEVVTLYQENLSKHLPLKSEEREQWSQLVKDTFAEWRALAGKFQQTLQQHFNLKLNEGKIDAEANFTQAYNDLQVHWTDMLEAMESGLYNNEQLNKVLPKEEFQKVVEKLTGLNPAKQLQLNAEQFDKAFQSYLGQYSEWQNRSTHRLEEVAQRSGQFLGHDWLSTLGLTNEAMNTLHINKLPLDNETEVHASLRHAQKEYAQYVEKSLLLNIRVYDAAQKGLIRTMDSFWQSYQRFGQLPQYDEFMNAWVKELEEQYDELLNTEEFSALIGKVKDARNNTRHSLEEIMQKATTNLPFVQKTEVEELKTEIDKLKTELARVKKEAAKQPTAAPSTATTKTPASAGTQG